MVEVLFPLAASTRTIRELVLFKSSYISSIRYVFSNISRPLDMNATKQYMKVIIYETSIRLFVWKSIRHFKITYERNIPNINIVQVVRKTSIISSSLDFASPKLEGLWILGKTIKITRRKHLHFRTGSRTHRKTMQISFQTTVTYRVEHQTLPVEFFLEFLPHTWRYEYENWPRWSSGLILWHN